MEEKVKSHIGREWYNVLKDQIPSLASIFASLRHKKAQSKIIYPDVNNVFRAFKLTPYDKVRVVILGQDPYHYEANGIAVADGLAFSSGSDSYQPPSLKNILSEVENNCYDGFSIELSDVTSLDKWAEQGVFLINTALTVEKYSPGSHSLLWKEFTTNVIKRLNEREEMIFFLLWGNHAKRYDKLINREKHVVLEAGHPSPLNTKVPFKGCEHFAFIWDILNTKKEELIEWV